MAPWPSSRSWAALGARQPEKTVPLVDWGFDLGLRVWGLVPDRENGKENGSYYNEVILDSMFGSRV